MKIRLAFILFMIASSSATALPCENIISQINKEISQYRTSINHEQLPWMSLSWLQQKLGNAKTSKSENGGTTYTWQCKKNGRNYLTVTSDSTGTLTEVEGRYSSANSAQMFSTCLNDGCHDSPKTNATVDISQLNSCSRIAKEIYGAGIQFQNNEQRPRNIIDTYHPQYMWENKRWLENNLGAPTISSSAKNNIYTWKCSKGTENTNKNIVYLITSPSGSSIFSSQYCDKENCYTSYVSRIFGDIKTTVTTTPN
jgi:hypothetical protein